MDVNGKSPLSSVCLCVCVYERERELKDSLKSRSFEFFICLVKLCSEILAFNTQAGE